MKLSKTLTREEYQRLVNAVKLVLAIADHPESNVDVVRLAPKTREQLEAALSCVTGSD
jgi:hypothetical protein